jgi:hypothetical protein
MSLLEGPCPRCGTGEVVDDDDHGIAVCEQCGTRICLSCGGMRYRRGEEVGLGPCQCQVRAADARYRAGADAAEAYPTDDADGVDDDDVDDGDDGEVEDDGFPTAGIEGFDDIEMDEDEDDPMGEEDGPPGEDDPADA